MNDEVIALLSGAIAYTDHGAHLDLTRRDALKTWLQDAPTRGDLEECAFALTHFVGVLQSNGFHEAAVELLSLATCITPQLRELKIEETRRGHEDQRRAFDEAVGAPTPRAPQVDAPRPTVKGKLKRGLR